ncbi:hypothetical protein [Mycoplasmopsis agassizii]|nr:hypothetical protein [Mycoplasmopsis agassizii]
MPVSANRLSSSVNFDVLVVGVQAIAKEAKIGIANNADINNIF